MILLVRRCNYFPFSQESKKHNQQLHLTNVAFSRRRHREEGRRGGEPLAGEERRVKSDLGVTILKVAANANEKPGRKKTSKM